MSGVQADIACSSSRNAHVAAWFCESMTAKSETPTTRHELFDPSLRRAGARQRSRNADDALS